MRLRRLTIKERAIERKVESLAKYSGQYCGFIEKGEPCMNPSTEKDFRCALHTTLRYEGSGYAPRKSRKLNAVPSRFRHDFKEAFIDKMLVSVHEETALVDALMKDALGQVDYENCQAAWEKLGALFAKWDRTSEKNRDSDAFVQMIRELVYEGNHAFEQTKIVMDYVREKRNLVETEIKVQSQSMTSLNNRDALILIEVLVDAFTQEFAEFPERVARAAGRLDELLRSRVATEAARAGAEFQ